MSGFSVRSIIATAILWLMGGSLTRLAYLVSTLVVLVVLVYLDVLDPQAAIVVFLLMLVVLAYLRRGERLPYRELTNNIV